MKTQHTPKKWQVLGQINSKDDRFFIETDEVDYEFGSSVHYKKIEVSHQQLPLARKAIKCVNSWDDFESLVLRLRELVSKENTSVNFENALIDEANRIKRAKGGGNGNG